MKYILMLIFDDGVYGKLYECESKLPILNMMNCLS